jgi:hypothetical protein
VTEGERYRGWVRFLCALVVAGCGRVGFTPTTGDGAVSAATVCGASTSAPASVTLSGSVFTYTSFQNTTAPIANATITAFDADSGAQLGTATSDGSGNYSLAITTGGMARPLRLRLTNPAYMPTTIYTGVAIDSDVSGISSPMWGTSSMESVYSVAKLTLDTSLGTINATVLDCAGNPIAGATVDVEPAPAQVAYIAPNGYFEPGGTATIAPYTTAVSLNAPLGMTHISATMAGTAFTAQDVDVAGSAVTMVTLHPEP